MKTPTLETVSLIGTISPRSRGGKVMKVRNSPASHKVDLHNPRKRCFEAKCELVVLLSRLG